MYPHYAIKRAGVLNIIDNSHREAVVDHGSEIISTRLENEYNNECLIDHNEQRPHESLEDISPKAYIEKIKLGDSNKFTY